MHKVFLTIMYTFLIASCIELDKKEWKELSSQTDYSLFEDYILLTPETSHFDEAIDRIYLLKNEKDKESIIPIYPAYYGRNIIRLIIKNDSIIWIGEKYSGNIIASNLDSLAFDYILNNDNSENGPAKLIKEINGVPFELSMGRFLIIYDKNDRIEIMKNTIKKLNNSLTMYKNQIQIDSGVDDSKQLSKLIFDNRLEIFEYQKHKETQIR